MSEKPVQHEEIIEPKVFQPAADSADVLLEKLSLLIGGFKELARITGAKINSGIDPKTISDVDKLAAAKEKLAKIEKGLTDFQKLEVEIRTKQKKANKDLADQIKAQDGLLGNLLIKQKQLKESLVGAKTLGDIKRINQELFKTNGQIKNIKEGGTNAFNSWGNAVQSFQFKFNALGSAIGGMVAGAFSGLISSVVDFGIQGAKAFFESAKASGVFGESIKNSKINTEALQGALDAVEKQLSRIGKSQKEIVSDALDFGIGAKMLALEQAQRDANRIATEGLSDEDKQKVLDQRQAIADQITALNAEIELKRINAKKDAIKEEFKVTKEGDDADLAQLRLKIEKELALLKTGRDSTGTHEERLARVLALEESLQNIEKEFAERRKKREEEALKKKTADNKIAEREAEESLQRQFKAFTDYWDKVDAEDAKRQKELWKAAQDEADRLQKIEDDKKDDLRAKQKQKDAQDAEDKRKALEAFVQYELEALEGKFGKAEKKIAREQIRTKIALGIETPEELAAYNKILQDEKKAAIDRDIDMLDRFSNAAVEGLKERNDKELQQNADKITELDRQIAFQRELALKGEVNSLQEVEKARAEALAQKAAMEKRAANQAKGEKAAEIFLEFYKAYANEKEGAFMKALTATAKGKGGEAIVKALFAGSFKEGTEDTGGPGNVDRDGGKVAIIHPHERIFTKEHNEMMGGLSNEEVAGSIWKMNNLYPNMQPISDDRTDLKVAASMMALVRDEIRKQTKAIENPPYLDFQRNALNEIIEMDRKLGGLTQTTHKRIGTSYSRD